MMSSLISQWNEFFHSRIIITKSNHQYNQNNNAFQWIGYLRIIYGLCVLYDRIILSLDFNMFFLYPTSITTMNHSFDVLPLIPCQQYMLPVSTTMTHSIVDTYLPYSPLCSIASYLPVSYHSYIFYLFHIVSIVSAILLIANVYPKLQLVLLHINMLSFHFHSLLIWDGEDVMFKLWNFLFLFLPLQLPTLKKNKVKKDDDDGDTKSDSDLVSSSYPIWPMRLFQIELCCIYAGAGYAKLSTTTWRSGNALYHVIHEKDFFGGPYVPEFIFHKYGPLKLATWSSLLLECSCIFLAWSNNKYIKYGTVLSMIALHLGIESTMNMHVFEILSIVGWCMFFIQPDVSHREYERIGATTTSRTTTSRSFQDMIYSWFINIFLIILITIFFLDTFPLYEIHEILEGVMTVPLSALLPTITSPSKLSFVSGLAYVITNVQTKLLYLNSLRQDYFFPYIMKYLYPIGLYQAVWNLYSGAPDTNCIFTTNITTYTIVHNNNSSHHQMNSYAYVSPDWGTMPWYTKKRYQRPMTMQEKLESFMCRDCYVRYHANKIMKDALSNDKTNITNIQLASATLMGKCENPPLPPAKDDWFNWSGWFYADAKQDVLVQHDPVLLYATNICNDLHVELCQQYFNEGLCYTAQHNHVHRHSFNNGTILTDNDAFVFNITQTCRQSCNFCPEDGYDANNLMIGTRLSIFWPIPTWDDAQQTYFYDATSMYYDGTIIQVRDRPLKQYLIKYDDSYYNNEWFDPMTLRDRGYHFIPDIDNEDIVDDTPDHGNDDVIVMDVHNDENYVGDDDDDVNIEEIDNHGDEL